jgi:putative transposase
VAVVPGYRESTESWGAVFRDLKGQGIQAPKLILADGLAGIWAAAREVWPESKEQRCWNHKMRNVLDRLPKREQVTGRDLLRKIVYAPSREAAVAARGAFEKRFEPWYPKAVETLGDDWDRMVTFYDFPEQHWRHLRTTNVVESPFASVRLRTTAAKRFKRVDSATTLIWKLLTVAERRFRKLNAPHLLQQVAEGHIFRDGKPVHTSHGRVAA